MSNRYEEKAWEIVEGWFCGTEYSSLVYTLAAALREAEAELLREMLADIMRHYTGHKEQYCRSFVQHIASERGIELEAKADVS